MLIKQNIDTEDTIFVQFLKRFFKLIGRNVAAKPYFVIFTCLLITILSSSSLFLNEMTNDITDFTPKDARALTELKVYNNFFGHKGDPVTVFVFVTAKDGGSMLRVKHLNETVQLLDTIANDLQIRNEKKNKTLSFSQFCTSFCDANEPVRNVYNGLLINEQYDGTSEQIKIGYPVTTILGQKLRIDDSFYGVEVGEQNALLDAQLILLQFRAMLQDRDNKKAERYELEVTNFLQNNFKSDIISVVSLSSSFITFEIVRAGLSLLPFTAIGFVLMCLFSVITTSISSILASQFHYNKLLIAIAACISPLLACATALGILLWCGLRFGSILTSTPLLVLAIGVDDAFLMINHWQQIYHEELMSKEFFNSNKMERLSNRICNVLEKIGPSITITTLTNVLAFSIGVFTSVPEIEVFCLGNAAAMLIAFIYQITLFAAIMIVLEGHGLEIEKSENMKHKFEYMKNKILDDLNSTLENLLNKYCATLCTTSFSLFTLAGLLFYWSISIYGAFTMNVELKPEHLIKEDSDIAKVLQLRDAYIMPYYAPALIFVDKPGNLNDPNNVQMLNQIVIDFEKLPTSVGRTATKFWLRDYLDFIDTSDQISLDGSADNNLDYEYLDRNLTEISIKQSDLENFLHWTEFRHWDGFMQFDLDENGMEYLKSYFFKISSCADLRKWSNRAKLLNQLRNVADQHPEHEVYVFDDDAKFLDIIGTLLYQTIQSSIFIVLFMMFVCFLFIPNYIAVTIATFSIISIFIGVLGILSIWGVDLDPIVMSALIMSIGFSVDIPTHVIYHFFKAGKETTEASLRHCLRAIGFPVLQAALSTLLCVSSLQFSPLHMGRVFVKTMVLVVTIGFIHGVVVIPVLYSILSHIQLPRRKRIIEINNATSSKPVTLSDDKAITQFATDEKLRISIE